jgi:periplasmic protein TonB
MFDAMLLPGAGTHARNLRGFPFALAVHAGVIGLAAIASRVALDAVRDPDLMIEFFAPRGIPSPPPPPLGPGTSPDAGRTAPAHPVPHPVAPKTETLQPLAAPQPLQAADLENRAVPDAPAGTSGNGTGDGVPWGDPDGVPNGTGEAGRGGDPFGTGGPAQADPEPLPVIGNVVAPEPLQRVDPEYPETARRARVEGRVVLRAVIGANGRVEDVSVISGSPLLTQASIDAVRRWLYRPATLDGAPVRVWFRVFVYFRLR